MLRMAPTPGSSPEAVPGCLLATRRHSIALRLAGSKVESWKTLGRCSDVCRFPLCTAHRLNLTRGAGGQSENLSTGRGPMSAKKPFARDPGRFQTAVNETEEIIVSGR